MKKKSLWAIIALAGLTISSCTNDEVIPNTSVDNAIEFGTYLGRDAQTRASVFGNDVMKTAGFGVYAYYTAQTAWESYASKNLPNFMNNTKVTWNSTSSKWEYTPVKYWPNNTNDKVSFFAYAPWQENDRNRNSNITLNQGAASLDFKVQNDVTKQTDLTWSATEHMDETKQSIDGQVDFLFKHALARIDFTLQAAVDQAAAGGTIAEGTTITLKKIVLGTEINGFYTNGTLDLTKATATWLGSTLTGRQKFTLVPDNFVTDSNVLDKDHNAKANLIDANGDDYIMIIPQKKENLSVYVEYTVETVSNDGNDNSTIENKITTPISSIDFQAGKAYTLNLVLGMTSVKLEASVEPWDVVNPGTEVDLPENI